MRSLLPLLLLALPALFLPVRTASTQPLVGYWDPRFEAPSEGGLGFSRPTEALALHPVTGDVYAGGQTSGFGLRERNEPVVRWTGDGWASLGSTFDGPIYALAFGDDGTLYAGGDFTTVDGAPVSNVAQYDGNGWSAMGQGIDGQVNALAVDPATGDLYAGGYFDNALQMDGTPVTADVVRWTGSAWQPVGGGSDRGRIDALAFDPVSGELFVGGELSPGLLNADGTLADVDYLAQFDGSTWRTPEDPDLRLSSVNALLFDPAGRLYVGHNGDGGVVVWDRTRWSMPAGGLGVVEPNGRRTAHAVHALALGDRYLYVGGTFTHVTQADGTTLLSSGIVAYDPATDRFHHLGEGVQRRSTAGHEVSAIAVRPGEATGEELFIGGTFSEAGAMPLEQIARWTSVPPWPATEVTFRVDMRTPMRLGLLGSLSYAYFTNHRPLVEVFSGSAAGSYLLYDIDGDSIWTARVPLPRSSSIEYAYGFDVSGNGFDGSDWVFELGASPSPLRQAQVLAASSQTLPIASFDDFPLMHTNAEYAFRANAFFAAGNPAQRGLPAGAPTGRVRVDPERLDRPMQVAARLYYRDPGGAPPEGVAVVAETAFWSIAHAPQTADYAAEIRFDYTAIPGADAPADLRLLYRAHADTAWEVVPADVDPVTEEILSTGVVQIAGEWTIGSASAANILTTDPPSAAANPRPSDYAGAAPLRPLLRWDGGERAQSYDLYFWEANQPEPASPTRTNIGDRSYQWNEDLVVGNTYKWRILSRSINGEAPGPVWTFTVGSVPDLAVGSVEVPPSAFSGQPIQVRWTVQNDGDGGTNAPIWYDEVYLSTTSTFQKAEATRIGRFRNVSFLAPGDGYANEQRVTVPDGTQGSRFIHVVADASDQLDESNEMENAAQAPLHVTLTDYADLRVTEIVAPANVFSGDSVDVQFTVTNAGSGRTDATSWFDAIFLSEADSLDFNFTSSPDVIRLNDALLGRAEHFGALEPGASYSASLRVKLPDAAVGDLTLFAYADVAGGAKQPIRGEAYEFNVELNNWTAHSLSSTLTPPPDLVVTGITPPETAESGEEIELSWTVENRGPGATRSDRWMDVVYYSPTAYFDAATAQVLGSFFHAGGLGNDESYVATGLVTVPDGAHGDGYFFVQTDLNAQVFEHTFEENNLSGTDNPAAVSRAPYPDMQVENLRVSVEEATAGEQVALHFDVTNDGTARADEWTDQLYVSAAESWNPEQATSLALLPSARPLDAGASDTRSITVTLPADLDGTLYLYVVADGANQQFEYPDQQNNVARSAAISVSPYPPVDLAAAMSIAPSSVESGIPFDYAVEVTNLGAGRTLAASWTDALYLSLDDSLDPEEDVLLHALEHEGAVSGSATYTMRGRATVPEGTEGPYYLIAAVDLNEQVGEQGRANNVAARAATISVPPGADLRTTNVSAPSSARAGQPVDLSWVVENAGLGPTRADRWFDAVYLSTNAILDPADVKLTVVEHDGVLAASGSVAASARVVVPAHASGEHYLLVQTDSRDDVYEHIAEGNNVAASQTDVVLPEPVDLIVSEVSAPPTAGPGQEMTVSWTLTNTSANPAEGVMREAVYLSTDREWDIDDPLVGIVERTLDLPAGASGKMHKTADLGATYRINEDGEITEVMPAVAPDDYYVIVRTDITRAIRETDVDNNVAASESTVEATVPVIALGESMTVDVASGSSFLVAVDVPTGGQDLQFEARTVDQDGSVQLYVRRDEAPTSSQSDASAVQPFEHRQELQIPAASSGRYYVLVSAVSDTDAPVTLTIAAQALEFGITAVVPEVGGNRGTVTVEVFGAQFAAGGTLVLRDANGGTIEAFETTLMERTALRGRFDLRGAEVGKRDVLFRSPDGAEAVLQDGYEIIVGDGPRPYIRTSYPEMARSFEPVVIEVTVGNAGHNNALDQMVLIKGAGFELVRPMIVVAGKTTAPEGTEEESVEMGMEVPWLLGGESYDSVPIAVRHDEDLIVPYWFIELPAGSEYTFNVIIFHEVLVGSVFHLPRLVEMDRSQFTETNRFEDLQTAAGYQLVREATEKVFDALWPDAAASAAGKTQQDPVSNYAKQRIDDALHVGWFQRQWDRLRPRTQAAALGVGVGALVGATYASAGIAAAVAAGCATVIGCGPVIGAALVAALPTIAGGAILFGTIGGLEVILMEETRIVGAFDPNDIIGPASFGAENWVRKRDRLRYRIRFENDPNLATAPAQLVDIRHPLDPTVDARSFRLGEFGFGNLTFTPPENVSFFRDRLDVASTHGVLVDVTAGIDVDRNEAFWVFQSIDPETGTPPASDPFAGFLPINDSTGVGEGFASYAIRVADEARTGDEIEAAARIVFDTNEPIDTPRIINTVDADAPRSAVQAVPAWSDTTSFRLSWSGDDAGSGLRLYDLYVSEDGGPFTLHESAISDTSYLFVGESGHRYRFFTLATDNVGNVEAMKTSGDTVIPVSPEEDESAEVPGQFALHANYPNPFNPITTIPFDVAEASRVEITLYNLLGQRMLRVVDESMQPGRYEQRLDLSRFASGVYFYEMTVRGDTGRQFRDVRKLVMVK